MSKRFWRWYWTYFTVCTVARIVLIGYNLQHGR